MTERPLSTSSKSCCTTMMGGLPRWKTTPETDAEIIASNRKVCCCRACKGRGVGKRADNNLVPCSVTTSLSLPLDGRWVRFLTAATPCPALGETRGTSLQPVGRVKLSNVPKDTSRQGYKGTTTKGFPARTACGKSEKWGMAKAGRFKHSTAAAKGTLWPPLPPIPRGPISTDKPGGQTAI